MIDNYPADQVEYFDLPNNPNRDANDTTTRPVAFTKEVWIDKSDFFEVPPPKFKRLTLGSEVRLMGAYLVRCTGVDPQRQPRRWPQGARHHPLGQLRALRGR